MGMDKVAVTDRAGAVAAHVSLVGDVLGARYRRGLDRHVTRRAEELRQQQIKAHAGDVVLVVDDQLVSRRSDQEGEESVSRT